MSALQNSPHLLGFCSKKKFFHQFWMLKNETRHFRWSLYGDCILLKNLLFAKYETPHFLSGPFVIQTMPSHLGRKTRVFVQKSRFLGNFTASGQKMQNHGVWSCGL